MRTLLPMLVIGAIASVIIILAMSIHQRNTATCLEMMEWRVYEVPTKCLSEIIVSRQGEGQ